MTTKNGRACDACRRRKVKCDKRRPECQQCSHLNLKCIYSEPEGRQASRLGNERGKVLKAYKKGAKTGSINGGGMLLPKLDYDEALFERLVPEYLNSIYPVFPIIAEAELRSAIGEIHASPESAAMVYAAFAITINHTRTTFPGFGEEYHEGVVRMLMGRALDARGPIRTAKSVTIPIIMVDVFLSSVLVALDEVEIAWFYLREAITLAMIMRLGNEERLKTYDLAQRAQRQRLYWLMFIHERFVAVNFHRVCQLSPLYTYPENDGVLGEAVYQGFLQIIKNFSIIDENFVNAYLGDKTHIDKHWLDAKQQDVLDLETGLDALQLPSMMRADLSITQQWLKIVLWKMAMARYRLDLDLEAGPMSLLFPIEIARRLHAIVTTISLRDISVHGCSLIQKLFELTISISDVISLIPAEQLQESEQRIQSYLRISDFLFKQPTVRPLQKDLLAEKVQNVKKGIFPDYQPSPISY